MPYKRILVPVDGSSTAAKGLQAAVRLARENRAKLRLLYVLEQHAAFTAPEIGADIGPILEAMKVGGRKTLAHRLPGPAWRLLNAWLEATGDYAGIAVLRFYLVYRAMVRAKIACLRGSGDQFRLYLGLAQALAEAKRPALILMHGLSGSGKTTV